MTSPEQQSCYRDCSSGKATSVFLLPWAGTNTLGGIGARIALHAELLPSLLPSEGAFSDVVDGLIQENFSGGKPPDPPITVVLLGDKYSKHCPSGKELEDQNLPLWKNMHIHRCALRGCFAPLP